MQPKILHVEADNGTMPIYAWLYWCIKFFFEFLPFLYFYFKKFYINFLQYFFTLFFSLNFSVMDEWKIDLSKCINYIDIRTLNLKTWQTTILASITNYVISIFSMMVLDWCWMDCMMLAFIHWSWYSISL